MQKHNNYYEEKMKDLFERTKKNLSKNDVEVINQLIVVGEYIVAYEVLCDQLYEYRSPIEKETYAIIEEIGRFIDGNESTLIHLKSLVTEDL